MNSKEVRYDIKLSKAEYDEFNVTRQAKMSIFFVKVGRIGKGLGILR